MASRSAPVLLLGLALVVAAGCRDPAAVPRQSRLEQIDLSATVQPDGTVAVQAQVTFVDAAGGLVEVPVVPGLAEVTDLAVDGQPIAVTPGGTEIPVTAATATLGYTVHRAVETWPDIAVLRLAVHADASDASRQDPEVAFHGTITLPEAATVGEVLSHWHTALDRQVVIDGRTVTLDGQVTAWAGSEVAIGFSPGAVQLPAGDAPLLAHATPHRADFEAQQAVREEGNRSLEATLDDQAAMAALVKPIFLGLAGSVLLVVIVTTQRVRWAERRRRARLDDDVPGVLTAAPGGESPAVVALLVADAERVGRQAVAGTVLGLVERDVLRLDGITSQEFVLHVPRDRPTVSAAESIVLDALPVADGPAADELRGPPLWPTEHDDLWSPFRRAVVTEARDEGLVDRAYKGSVFATYASVFFGCSWPLWVDESRWFLLPIVTIAGFILALPVLSHVRLTDKGVQRRARWLAFRRHLEGNDQLRDAGAPGIALWGSDLTHAAALGLASEAVQALSPPHGDEQVDGRADVAEDPEAVG